MDASSFDNSQAPINRPMVVFNATAIRKCPMCWPSCQMEHEGSFEWYDANGTLLFSCCIGCLTIAGMEYGAVAEALALGAVENLKQLLGDGYIGVGPLPGETSPPLSDKVQHQVESILREQQFD